jgi:hypothetical protein
VKHLSRTRAAVWLTFPLHQLFNRTDASLDVCKSYASRIISYCDTGDIYCDSGSNGTVHHLYIDRYGNQIVDFVVSQYQKAAGSSSNSSSTTTAPPATSATATPTSGGSGGRTNSTSSSPTKSASASTSPHSAANALTPAVGSLIFGAGLLAVLSQML